MAQKPTIFILYVPAAGSNHSFAKGSAIVASVDQRKSRRICVHYEGNLHGAAEFGKYEVRAFHAATRQQRRYPTTAKSYVAPEEIIEVGLFDLETGEVTAVTNVDLLSAWIPEEELWLKNIARGQVPASTGPHQG